MRPTSERSVWSVVRWVTVVVMIGVPAFAFLVAIARGAILAPLGGVLLLAPFVALNWLLWGRFFAPGKARAQRQPGDDGARAIVSGPQTIVPSSPGEAHHQETRR